MKTTLPKGTPYSLSVYSRVEHGWLEFEEGKKRYFFRSKWEMNYARYLDWLKEKKQIKEWLYEEDTFWFEKIRRGIRSYTPDFKIEENNGRIVYHEIKGWMDKKSATKIKRMSLYYPKVSLVVIGKEEYMSLKKTISNLCKWE